MRLASSCLVLFFVLGVLDSVAGECAPEFCILKGKNCNDFFGLPYEKKTDTAKCDFVQDGEVYKGRGSHKAICCDSEASYKKSIKTNAMKNQARALYGASPNEYPHQVVFKSRGSCGGTIYNKEWIITAAHCVEVNGDVFTKKNGDLPGSNKKAYVIAGQSHVKNATEDDKYYIDKIISHPNWNPMLISNGSDIAMLHLVRPLKLKKGKIQPMRLESADYVPPYGGKGYAIGFGNVNEAIGTASDDLMEAVGPIHSNTKAISISTDPLHGTDKGSTPKREHLSVGGEDSGLTVGQGDSGGPFICPDENNKPILCGIASFKTCEAFKMCKRPSYYVRVAPFLGFIQKATKGAKQETNLLFDKPMFPEKVPEPEVPGYLVRIGGEKRSCTGTLVSSTVIITAAECIAANGGSGSFIPNLYHVQSGTGLLVFATHHLNEFERDTSKIFSQFMKQPLNKNDVGAIFIREPVQTEYAELPPEGYELKGEAVEYSFNDLSNYMEKRHFVDVGEEDCTKRLQGVDENVQLNFDEQLCLRQVYSAEAVCERDVGGPLICEGKYFCGIKSFQACKYPGMPEIFSKNSGSNTLSTIKSLMAAKPGGK